MEGPDKAVNLSEYKLKMAICERRRPPEVAAADGVLPGPGSRRTADVWGDLSAAANEDFTGDLNEVGAEKFGDYRERVSPPPPTGAE
jgi:hypothetical protein